MRIPLELEQRIDELLAGALYTRSPERHEAEILPIFQQLLARACAQNQQFGHFVSHWPVDYQRVTRLADLPFLPAAAFKRAAPLALVPTNEIARVLTSSTTTGQRPSRIALDTTTARRMTRALTAILRDFLGPARRPYLVVDTPATLSGQGELGARAAAIQGLRAFASEIVCCLKTDHAGALQIDWETLRPCAARWANNEVLVYGLTHVLWNQLGRPLAEKGVSLGLPHARILHSGGWKRLQTQAVGRGTFARDVGRAFGCSPERVLDFYGLVEHVGVIYPDCSAGNKHAPAFAAVLLRDPLTLESVDPGRTGLVQVCSALPTSFPGFLVLTDDVGELICNDGCPCGRRGVAFRLVGRAPAAEVRGCGNLEPRAAS